MSVCVCVCVRVRLVRVCGMRCARVCGSVCTHTTPIVVLLCSPGKMPGRVEVCACVCVCVNDQLTPDLSHQPELALFKSRSIRTNLVDLF